MRRIFLLALLGVGVVALLLSDIPFGFYLYQVERDRLITQLQRDAFILGGRAEDALENPSALAFEDSRALAIAYRAEGGARVVIVDREGTAVVTNDEDDSREGLAYGTRPEIAQALEGRVATGQRFSDTLGIDLVYVAVPVYSGNSVIGVVRLTFDKQAIDDAVSRQLWGIYFVALVTLAFATALAVVLSRVLSRNLLALSHTAARLSAGDLSARADEPAGLKEITQLATGFNAMATRLQALVNEQKAFASDASHQLRTPLTALQLRVERLRESVGSESQADEKFDEIEDEIQRMRRLIDGLLALGRASVDELEREHQDLGALAEETGVSLTLSAPDSLVVEAVPTAIEQIIDNYIDNALSVMPQGGELGVTVTNSPAGALLEISDTLRKGPEPSTVFGGVAPPTRARAWALRLCGNWPSRVGPASNCAPVQKAGRQPRHCSHVASSPKSPRNTTKGATLSPPLPLRVQTLEVHSSTGVASRGGGRRLRLVCHNDLGRQEQSGNRTSIQQS
jgi:signal transduction histidine kinase